MVKYAIKDKYNKYYGFHGFGTYLSDADLYDDELKAKELIVGRSDIFNDGPYKVVPVLETKEIKELPEYPEAREARRKFEERLLRTCDHYDAVKTILDEVSFNHDANRILGQLIRACENTGMPINTKEILGYSNMADSYDKDSKRFLQGNGLAYKAQRAACFFAKLADGFALLDAYEKYYAEKMSNEK